MGKMNSVSKVFKSIAGFCKKHQSTLHMTTTLVGLGTTCYTSITGTIKAVRHVDEKKKELGKAKLTFTETVSVVWKDYIPTICSVVVTGTNAVCTKIDGDKKVAALATTLDLTTTAYNEYKSKVKEVIGEKEEAAIRKDIAEEHAKKDIVNNGGLPLDITHSQIGFMPCKDEVTGKWFMTNSQMIDHALLELSKRKSKGEEWLCVGDLYYEMCIDSRDMGAIIDKFGWDGYVPAIKKGFFEMDDGTKYMTIDYDYELERDTHGDLRHW